MGKKTRPRKNDPPPRSSQSWDTLICMFWGTNGPKPTRAPPARVSLLQHRGGVGGGGFLWGFGGGGGFGGWGVWSKVGKEGTLGKKIGISLGANRSRPFRSIMGKNKLLLGRKREGWGRQIRG